MLQGVYKFWDHVADVSLPQSARANLNPAGKQVLLSQRLWKSAVKVAICQKMVGVTKKILSLR